MRASYLSYKTSSIFGITSIPEHWKQIRLQFASIERIETNCQDLTLLSVYLNKGVIPYTEGGSKVHSPSEDLSLYKRVCIGDLVLNNQQAWRGSVGVSNYNGIISPAYYVFKPKDNLLQSGYLKYLSISRFMIDQYVLASRGVGDIQRQLKPSLFKYTMIPLPPLPEQTAIANYLDAKTEQINRFIAKKEKLIALLKEQKQAVINKAVTKGIRVNVPMKDSGVEWLGDIPSHWKVIKLKYIANAIIGVTYSPNDIVDEQKGILVLRSSNIQNGKLSFLDNVFIKKEISQKLLTQKGDILLCARNGSLDLIGKNVCIDDSAVGLTFGAFMTIVRSKYWGYLSWFFNSSIFKSQTGLFATSTINQLTSDTLNNLKIAFPTDSSEREEIIKTLEIETQQIDLGIEKIEKEIEKVKELKQSLIAEVVTGKIKVV